MENSIPDYHVDYNIVYLSYLIFPAYNQPVTHSQKRAHNARVTLQY